MERDWREFLELVEEAVPEPGAPAQEIMDAERRLRSTLPPGYRSFLAMTNGFGPIGQFVRRLRPVGEISWLRDEDPELIRIWVEATGDDALAATLMVSDDEDGARVLLNPAVVDEEGEWEAWFFAHWVPGAEPYCSFRALVEETYNAFRRGAEGGARRTDAARGARAGRGRGGSPGPGRRASPARRQRPCRSARRTGEPA